MPTFPSIAPNYCTDIVMPIYPAKDIEFDSGDVQTIQTGFRPTKQSMTLRYELITIAQVESLMGFWRTVGGTIDRFDLPSVVLRHPTAIVNQMKLGNNSLTSGNGGLWRFAEPFTVTPVVADVANECSRYNVSIKLQGILG